MSRRKRNKGAIAMQVAEVADLGPQVQHDNGRLVINREATDPDRPNGVHIRRAMRHPHYDRMHRKGDIDDAQREACDAYAVLTERRDGARWVNGERIAGNGISTGHPTMTQVQASARLSRAHAVLGGDASALMLLFVVQDIPITELARRRKEREEITKGRVLASIARLAEHWGMKELGHER